jgi:hypothetical protein
MGVKKVGVKGWQSYHVPIVLKFGSLNLQEPYGPVQACNEIALPLLRRSFNAQRTLHESLFKLNIVFYKRPYTYALVFEIIDFPYRHFSVTPTLTVICAFRSSDFTWKKIQSSEAKSVYIRKELEMRLCNLLPLM